MNNYKKEAEENLKKMIKQKEKNDKMLLTLEWIIGILSCFVLLIPIYIGVSLQMEEWQRIVIVLSGVIPFIVGLCFSIKIEQIAGYYECSHCRHKYVPTYKAVWLSPHMGRTRYMRCPKCNKKSWQKKVISKE